MEKSQKLACFQSLCHSENLEKFYEVMEKTGAMAAHYQRYMTTQPINCDLALQRIPDADYALCCALMTMVLREDHFRCGSFRKRLADGSVSRLLNRILKLLSE